MKKIAVKNKLDTKSLILCSLFAALVCIGAFIKIPSPLVPFSLQWFFVAVSGLVLGSKLGLISVLLYLFIGLSGIPVFTQGGGLSYILKPTFGYLIGFAFAAYIIGYLSENRKKILKNFITANIAGLIVVYAVGFSYLYFIMTNVLGNDVILFDLFKAGVLLFVPTDILSLTVAAYVAKRLTKALKNM